jgi:prepilin-type processing-associated H-X9-DG protein
LAGARRKAYQTVCANNLRQLGMAIGMYANDHDGFPPIGAYEYMPSPPAPQQRVRVDWEDELISTAYVKTYNLFKCPSDSNKDYRAAYGANHYCMGWEVSPLLDAPPAPSHTVLLTEKAGWDWVAWPPNEQLGNPYYFPLDPRHDSQLNVLFVDGHVGHVIVNELIVGPNIIWRW